MGRTTSEGAGLGQSANQTWFTADLHLGDPTAIGYNGRPFPSVDEMTTGLIENWNGVVEDDHTVFVLGDFADTEQLFVDAHLRLKGKKRYIMGNHDPRSFYDPATAMAALPGAVVYDHEGVFVRLGKTRLWLSHRPFAAWSYNAIHLHGHRHGGRSFHKHDYYEEVPCRIDVGVDEWQYRPVSLGAILELVDGRDCW